MNKKSFASLSVMLMLLLSVVPVFAADPAKSVNLPGWFAWLLIVVALGLVAWANSFLRSR